MVSLPEFPAPPVPDAPAAAPYADIMARLDLAGVPVIAVSDTLLDFGVVYTNTPSDLTLEVSNAGFEPLHVSGVFTDNPAFTADSTGFDLAPAGSPNGCA